LRTFLKNIAEIQTGLYINTISEGDVVYLQAKHFDENGRLNVRLHPNLTYNSTIEKHLLHQGDVLFAAKGTKNFATCILFDHLPLVASTSFFVIRIKNTEAKDILPEFLTWYINHPVSQNYLKANAIGTSMVSISKEVLKYLEIPIIDIQTQKNVLKIDKLKYREKELQDQLILLRDKILQQQLLNALNQI